MIKRTNSRTIILAAALVICLSVTQSKIHAAPSDSLVDPGITTEAGLSADSSEKMTDSEKENMAKERLIHSILQIADKTEFGQKIKRLENTVSDYMKFDYFKPFNKETSLVSEKEADTCEKGYGLSFAPKLDAGSPDNLGVKADFTYSGTIVLTEYELEDNMVAIEFSNTTLNRRLDATASFGMAESDSETSFIFKLNFEFD